METYILQKDLPDVKAGAKFELGKATDAFYLTSDKTGTKYNAYVYPLDFVRNNPEWFKKEEPVQGWHRGRLVNLLNYAFSKSSCVVSVRDVLDNFLAEEKKQPEQKPIEVMNVILDGTSNRIELFISSNVSDIPLDKAPEIRKAIEAIINYDKVLVAPIIPGYGYSVDLKDLRSIAEALNKKYSEQELLQAEENAFKAAKKKHFLHHPLTDAEVFRTFSDYKNQK